MSSDYKIPDGYRYTKDHEWVRRDENNDNVIIVGITDYAQHAMGDIVHVELPSVGDEFSKGDEAAIVESAKSASEIYAPVSGQIVKGNDNLDSHPEHINAQPYDDGWLFKIELSDPDELDLILSSDGYTHFLEEEDN